MLLLVRSIPLSRETRDAWRSVGVHVVKRSHLNDRDVLATVSRLAGRGIINLGNLDCSFTGSPVPVFNSRDSIRAVSSPLALRRTLNDFIPDRTVDGAHWHKRGGFGGKGKEFHAAKRVGCTTMLGDSQRHIDGVEFRVITVGSTVVQAHRKELLDGVGNFDWHWCGVDGIRTSGIIPTVKEAISQVPNWEHTVFGWDFIVGDNDAKVIEINTSPGVNEHTARRIVEQIERVI